MVAQDSERRPWSHLNCQKSPSLSVQISAPPLCSQHKGKVKSCQGSLKANEEFTRSSGFHSWWWCSMMLMLILGDHFNFDIASSEALVWSSMHFLPILTTLATIKRNIAMFYFTKKQNPHILSPSLKWMIGSAMKMVLIFIKCNISFHLKQVKSYAGM